MDFTPEEQRVLAMYRDPGNSGLGRSLLFAIRYALAGALFAAVGIITDNALWSLAVLAVLMVEMGIRLLGAKKIVGIMPRIIQKFEDRISQLESGSSQKF